MRGGEHEVARDRDAAAKAALARQHHHRMCEFRRGLRPADHRGGGSAQGQDDEGGNRARASRRDEPVLVRACQHQFTSTEWCIIHRDTIARAKAPGSFDAACRPAMLNGRAYRRGGRPSHACKDDCRRAGAVAGAGVTPPLRAELILRPPSPVEVKVRPGVTVKYLALVKPKTTPRQRGHPVRRRQWPAEPATQRHDRHQSLRQFPGALARSVCAARICSSPSSTRPTKSRSTATSGCRPQYAQDMAPRDRGCPRSHRRAARSGWSAPARERYRRRASPPACRASRRRPRTTSAGRTASSSPPRRPHVVQGFAAGRSSTPSFRQSMCRRWSHPSGGRLQVQSAERRRPR